MKSLNRLIYTITKGNKPNGTDVQALNEIIQYVNQEKQRQLENNNLFAKLFISTFKNELLQREGKYQLILDSIRIVLKIPLEEHYNALHEEMNYIELMKFAKSKGISMKHPALRTPEETKKDSELLKTYELDLINHLDHFKKEAVYSRTNKLLNNLIEDYEIRKQ